MNDRIKELQTLATEDILGVKILNAEKFARLIIQECQNAVAVYVNECGEIASLPEYVLVEHFTDKT